MSRTSIHAEAENEELEKFRRQWQQEIKQQKQGSSSDEARAQGQLLYQRAEKAETGGDLYKAVRLYRQAFKLCPELDSLQYSQSYQKTKSRAEKSEPVAKTTEEAETDLFQADENEVLQSVDMTFQPQIPTRSLHLSSLPQELLLTIFGGFEAKTLERCGRVCKGWLALSRHPKLWRTLCLETWDNLLLLKSLFREYKSWRKLYVERPRLRFDGMYISKNKYYRKGENEGLYYQSLHEVVYYRYLLFTPSGLCYSATSFEKPSAFVPSFENILAEGHNEMSKPSKEKILKGCYEIDEAAGKVNVHVNSANLTYSIRLEMKTSNRGTNHWLRVLHFSSRKAHDTDTDTEESEYNIPIDRYVYASVPAHLLPSLQTVR